MYKKCQSISYQKALLYNSRMLKIHKISSFNTLMNDKYKTFQKLRKMLETFRKFKYRIRNYYNISAYNIGKKELSGTVLDQNPSLFINMRDQSNPVHNQSTMTETIPL